MDAEGTPFGRYRLIELLGRDGMGEVWRAYDTDTDRIVALKVLPETLSKEEVFQERFRRKAHAAAQLNNPQVIPILHYGEIDGRLYVDMRLIEGRDLHTVLAEGPLEPGRAVRSQLQRDHHAGVRSVAAISGGRWGRTAARTSLSSRRTRVSSRAHPQWSSQLASIR